MARPKSTEHALKRAEILDRAADCFAAKSYVAASMNDIAAACGTSKARLYHYYPSKDTILFDLLDGYTQQLVALIDAKTLNATSALAARKALHALIRHLLVAYEHSATRHIALVSSVPFLPERERTLIVARQRELIHHVSSLITKAYPQHPARLHRPLSMMLFGMINWTFTWLKPKSEVTQTYLTHAEFAELVIHTLEKGFAV